MRSGSEDDDVGGRKDYLIRNQSASQSAIDIDSSISKIHNFGSYSKQRSIKDLCLAFCFALAVYFIEMKLAIFHHRNNSPKNIHSPIS